MKKILILLAILAIAMMPISLKAQTINVSALIGELVFTNTDSIMLTPGVYEYLVTIPATGEKVYMISLNDDLYKQIKNKGKKIAMLEGAEIDNVIKERLLREYRKKLEKKEEGINRELKTLEKAPDGEKRADKKIRKETFKEKTLELKKTQKEKEDYMNQFDKILSIRKSQGLFLSYNNQFREK